VRSGFLWIFTNYGIALGHWRKVQHGSEALEKGIAQHSTVDTAFEQDYYDDGLCIFHPLPRELHTDTRKKSRAA
jgi:hypothetical protein